MITRCSQCGEPFMGTPVCGSGHAQQIQVALLRDELLSTYAEFWNRMLEYGAVGTDREFWDHRRHAVSKTALAQRMSEIAQVIRETEKQG